MKEQTHYTDTRKTRKQMRKTFEQLNDFFSSALDEKIFLKEHSMAT